MEKPWRVKFRNVDQTYFPQTRVECRYTISGHHKWSGHDWIGLFKDPHRTTTEQVGWESVRDYYTFAWALAPEGYTVGTEVNCSVLFQPSYLPSPGGTAFQFVYVDELGEICAVSPQFTFCTPRPLDELVTLEEDRNGAEENEGEDLLLVVPKAQILQSHLEACQQELKQLQKKLDETTEEAEKHRERNALEMADLEKQRAEMKNEIEDLRESLRCSVEKMEKVEEKHKDMLKSSENISTEFSSLLAERAENQQRIKTLEEDLLSLTQQKQEAEAELDRMKERVKKMTTQRRDEDDERRSLQVESEQAREELRITQERLEASERTTEALRRDLSELGALQSHSHGELHQVRLQAAQMTLQLSQANLALREGQATWSQERESMRQSAELDKERIQKLSRELQKKEEWLQEERAEREKLEVELGNEKDCNRELRASLRAIQKEREQQQLEKQARPSCLSEHDSELLDHIRLLQLRMEREADAKWAEAASTAVNIDSTTSAVETFGHTDVEEPPEIQPLTLKERHEDRQEQADQETSYGMTERYLTEPDGKEMEPVHSGVHYDPNAKEDKPLILSDVKGHIPRRMENMVRMVLKAPKNGFCNWSRVYREYIIESITTRSGQRSGRPGVLNDGDQRRLASTICVNRRATLAETTSTHSVQETHTRIPQLEHPHTVPADGAVGVEVEEHQVFWMCDSKPFILVLTTVPPHTGSLGVSTKTKAGLVTEDDPLPF
ncbi:hypothetical protein NFI96_016443 [Prochilodus magdalenae]|nr:hypothetical protein NFI96_016443 [Prochilodus magdalenae]